MGLVTQALETRLGELRQFHDHPLMFTGQFLARPSGRVSDLGRRVITLFIASAERRPSPGVMFTWIRGK